MTRKPTEVIDAMDASELSRLSSTMLAAVTEAERLVRERPKGYASELRELVRHAREMHELLLEALLQSPILATFAVRDIAETSGRSIDQLEAVAIPHGAKH